MSDPPPETTDAPIAVPPGLRATDSRAAGTAAAAAYRVQAVTDADVARWAYVGNVWVEESHRRRGVATLLMERVLDWCRAEGMQRVVLNPSEDSVPLYRRLGFRPADDLLRLDV